jgi:hypothetical protein
MAVHTLALPEILAMMEAVGLSNAQVTKFRKQAEAVLAHREPLTRADDAFEVGSGYSHTSSSGHVRFKTGGVEHQLDPRKAKQIGLWLIEASEAAIADHCIMQLLRDKVGVNDPSRLAGILLDLREIRQGTRDVRFEM